MSRTYYLVALGSNIRHHRHGSPRQVLRAALQVLNAGKGHVQAASSSMESVPIGPSLRRYANGVAIVQSKRDPHDFLAKLKKIERQFGRRQGGQPWRARVLDLDIVLWSGGSWVSPELIIPHPQFRYRSFVTGPAAQIAGDWRDPISGQSIRQLHMCLTRRRPLPRGLQVS